MIWVRRIIWGIAGIVSLFWLGYEDRNLTFPIVAATLIAFALGFELQVKWTQRKAIRSTVWLLRSILIGVFAGAIVSPIIVVLVLVKTILPPHPTTDFELIGMKFLLSQSLTWIAAGALFGAAAGFLRISRK